MLRYTLHLKDGRWVGGFQCLRSEVDGQLMDLMALASQWGQPIIATKVAPRGKREVHVVGPVPGLEIHDDQPES